MDVCMYAQELQLPACTHAYTHTINSRHDEYKVVRQGDEAIVWVWVWVLERGE